MQLLISNEQNEVEIDGEVIALIQKALEKVLEEEKIGADPEVSMVLVDDERMAALNQQYRGISGTTDVLSFSMLDENAGEMECPDPCGEILLGDIVISVPRALEQSRIYGHSFSREMVFLAVHGMLHLLGYDHEAPEDEAVMREREKKVLSSLGLERK